VKGLSAAVKNRPTKVVTLRPAPARQAQPKAPDHWPDAPKFLLELTPDSVAKPVNEAGKPVGPVTPLHGFSGLGAKVGGR